MNDTRALRLSVTVDECDALFRVFVAPFFSRVAVVDGIASVRRAYTPPELADVVHSTGVRFHHSVAPGYTSQTFDITY